MSEYCKYCGEKYSDAKSLLSNSCSHHPSGFRKGRHALFEGDKDGPFRCKFCGSSYPSLRTLVTNRCTKNPERGGNHRPAR